jgi:hypothetical protein
MKAGKLVATVALAGTLVVGGAGVASATTGSNGAASVGGVVAELQARRPLLRRAVVHVVSTTLQVTRQQLREGLKSGKTISEYATSIGKDPQTVVDALVKAADGRIDRALANGRISAERAETLKSKVPDRVNKLVNHQFGQHAPTTAPTTAQT